MKVFKSYDKWQTLCKGSVPNGEELKYYMKVVFQRGQEPVVDSIDIEPTRWWFKSYLGKLKLSNGEELDVVKPMLFVADWKELEVKPREKTAVDSSIEEFKAQNYAEYAKETETDTSFDITIEQEHLPFY